MLHSGALWRPWPTLLSYRLGLMGSYFAGTFVRSLGISALADIGQLSISLI